MTGFDPAQMSPSADLKQMLAPTGVLRAGINMSNFLLVSERTPDGGPRGVSPDMAAAIAAALDVPVQYVTYPNPGALADAAARDEWDIGLIGAEPQRAETIAFTPAYAEIEATYLVRADSALRRVEDVDRPGVRIAVADRAAYGLWLDRNIENAELVRAQGLDASLATFLDQNLDALAGLRPRLIADAAAHPGHRLMEGRFMTVQQAIGVPKKNAAAIGWLASFVAAARSQGLVASLIEKYGVQGLSVAGA